MKKLIHADLIVPTKKDTSKSKKKACKKLVKKATKKIATPRKPKMTAEEKKVIATEKAYNKNRALVEAENNKRKEKHEELCKGFEAFCKTHNIKAVAFFANRKDASIGGVTSKDLANYEVEGLLSVQGFTKK